MTSYQSSILITRSDMVYVVSLFIYLFIYLFIASKLNIRKPLHDFKSQVSTIKLAF